MIATFNFVFGSIGAEEESGGGDRPLVRLRCRNWQQQFSGLADFVLSDVMMASTKHCMWSKLILPHALGAQASARVRET